MDHLERLAVARARGESIAVIHYACENLHKAVDRPPAVACIVLRPVDGGPTQLFSRTQSPPGTDEKDVEVDLLRRYFGYAQSVAGTQFVHWNMSRAAYGFNALESRYRYLTGQDPPYQVPPSATHDLDDIVTERYGADYATHPKLPTLAQLNGMTPRYALPGGEEAERFDRGDFGGIDRSVEEKAGWITQIFGLLLGGGLDTLNSVGTIAIAGGNVDAVAVVVRIGQRLLYVERELAKRHGRRDPMTFSDEYDDQDLYRALLRLFFDDVRAEEHTPSYAGGSSRIDFLLPEVGIAVELKHTRTALTAKDVGDQLTVDAARYAAHPAVRHLVCIVIDHEGLLTNPRGLEGDLGREARTDGLAVTVAIIDR